MSNAMAFNMTADTVYLWTLTMFHCNGWSYTWAITAVGGTHVCLRKVQADHVLERIERCKVTHMRSEEHTSELQSLMRISYADFCLKKRNNTKNLKCNVSKQKQT